MLFTTWLQRGQPAVTPTRAQYSAMQARVWDVTAKLFAAQAPRHGTNWRKCHKKGSMATTSANTTSLKGSDSLVCLPPAATTVGFSAQRLIEKHWLQGLDMQLHTAKKGSLAHTRTNSAAPMQVCWLSEVQRAPLAQQAPHSLAAA